MNPAFFGYLALPVPLSLRELQQYIL